MIRDEGLDGGDESDRIESNGSDTVAPLPKANSDRVAVEHRRDLLVVPSGCRRRGRIAFDAIGNRLC